MAVAAVAGGLWMHTRSPEYEARARVSFVDWIEPGATDAERARILDVGEEAMRAEVATVAPHADVETSAPAGRNFIDVVVAADSPDGLIAAVRAGSAVLVAGERSESDRRLAERAQAARDAADQLGPAIAALEDDMAAYLKLEAAAEARKNSGENTEEVLIEARTASDGYWKAARERNALVDQQNEFVREALRLEAEQRGPLSHEVTSASQEVVVTRQSSALAGALGGAAVAAATMLVLWAALRRNP